MRGGGGGGGGGVCSWVCIGTLLVLGGATLHSRWVSWSNSERGASWLAAFSAHARPPSHASHSYNASLSSLSTFPSLSSSSSRHVPPLVPMSLAGSFMADRRRRGVRRWASRPLQRGGIIVGSHSALGMQVLRRVFGALCARPRLALSCEGRSPDSDRARKLRRAGISTVRFERGAARLRAALRAASTVPEPRAGTAASARAAPTRVVVLLWDPLESCVAEWRRAQSNASLLQRCIELDLEAVGPLLRSVAKWRDRGLVLRLSDISGSEGIALAKWRQMFHFLGLHEKGVHLASIASSAARNDREGALKSKVRNTNAPAWAREVIRANATLSTALRRLRRELASV